MKSLKTLIHVSDLRLTTLSKQMNDFLQQKKELEELLMQLENQFTFEQGVASSQITYGFDVFFKRFEDAKEQLLLKITQIDDKMSVLQEEIRDAFFEKKRYEKLQQINHQKLEEKNKKQEQKFLDDVASWSRKNYSSLSS